MTKRTTTRINPARVRSVKLLVEADHFAFACLHKQWWVLLNWESLPAGAFPVNEAIVGAAGDTTIRLSFSWQRINGNLVGFYTTTSPVTDRRIVQRWLEKNFDCPVSDAEHFSNTIIGIGIRPLNMPPRNGDPTTTKLEALRMLSRRIKEIKTRELEERARRLHEARNNAIKMRTAPTMANALYTYYVNLMWAEAGDGGRSVREAHAYQNEAQRKRLRSALTLVSEGLAREYGVRVEVSPSGSSSDSAAPDITISIEW